MMLTLRCVVLTSLSGLSAVAEEEKTSLLQTKVRSSGPVLIAKESNFDCASGKCRPITTTTTTLEGMEAQCGDHQCSDGMVHTGDSGGCGAGLCTDQQCCVPEASCSDYHCTYGMQLVSDAGSCGAATCTDEQCCETTTTTTTTCTTTTTTMEASCHDFTCPTHFVKINGMDGCGSGTCDVGDCCEEEDTCEGFPCGVGYLQHVSDNYRCGKSTCGRSDCCDKEATCADFACGNGKVKTNMNGCGALSCEVADCCADEAHCGNHVCGFGLQPTQHAGFCGAMQCKDSQCCERTTTTTMTATTITTTFTTPGPSSQTRSCSPRPTVKDAGYIDSHRGWYDIRGCGQCNDYCRWVGNSGAGGDPASQLQHGTSWWSCQLSGDTAVYTPKDYFQTFTYAKCTECAARPTVVDVGYVDAYRGWYDIRGCGSCNDYCRWVGNSGAGGDPASRLQHGTSWWSCQLSGDTAVYTPKGHFQTWNYLKCQSGAHSTHRI